MHFFGAVVGQVKRVPLTFPQGGLGFPPIRWMEILVQS